MIEGGPYVKPGNPKPKTVACWKEIVRVTVSINIMAILALLLLISILLYS